MHTEYTYACSTAQIKSEAGYTLRLADLTVICIIYARRCVTWNLPAACTLDQPAAGKCCPTPHCPAGYTINYPPGYISD